MIRILTEAAINRAARAARDRIMKFGFDQLAAWMWDGAHEADRKRARRQFARRVYDDVMAQWSDAEISLRATRYESNRASAIEQVELCDVILIGLRAEAVRRNMTRDKWGRWSSPKKIVDPHPAISGEDGA